MTGWSFTGTNLGNTDECTLVATISFPGSLATVTVERTLGGTKVCEGAAAGPGPGPITLNEVGGSGVSGAVMWSGTTASFWTVGLTC